MGQKFVLLENIVAFDKKSPLHPFVYMRRSSMQGHGSFLFPSLLNIFHFKTESAMEFDKTCVRLNDGRAEEIDLRLLRPTQTDTYTRDKDPFSHTHLLFKGIRMMAEERKKQSEAFIP